MACRYWCGECDFRTPWLSRALGEEELVRHYHRDHRGIAPEGHVEAGRWPLDLACGCLVAAAAAAALLLIATALGRLP
ncbi:hypothetical protein ABH931_006753 [Streptacidiphilus sp. MAP12-33]|uniref:hypothetical protein n=1 Tax=Streptacidiphilus sp. MAP12-33 TaxID=3156266 RepID=UPI003517FF3F